MHVQGPPHRLQRRAQLAHHVEDGRLHDGGLARFAGEEHVVLVAPEGNGGRAAQCQHSPARMLHQVHEETVAVQGVTQTVDDPFGLTGIGTREPDRLFTFSGLGPTHARTLVSGQQHQRHARAHRGEDGHQNADSEHLRREGSRGQADTRHNQGHFAAGGHPHADA